MFDSEAKRGLDRAHRGEDYQELKREEDVDAENLGKLTPEDIEEFHAVAASMNTAMDEHPTDRFSKLLTPSQKFALEALYMAATAKDLETGEFISGIQRGELLNQALIHLQPILAMGLRPDFKEGRKIYDQLVSKVTHVKQSITSAILVQIMPKKKKKRPKKADQDDTGSPTDTAGQPEDAAVDAADTAEAADQADQDTAADAKAKDQADSADRSATD